MTIYLSPGEETRDMDIMLLGTGTPLPIPERAGTSIVIEIGSETILFDCGPQTVTRCVESNIDITEIEDLFFTHHHLDHNAAFFHFTIIGWFFGRENLTVYGPEGSDDPVQAIRPTFADTIKGWSEWKASQFDQDLSRGIDDIEFREVDETSSATIGQCEVSCLKVDHHVMDTFAYRVEELNGGSKMVFSAETAKLDRLAEFAEGADVLIHEANAWETSDELLAPDEVPDRFAQPMLAPYYRAYISSKSKEERSKFHSTPVEAAEVARDAGVETLVLTHLNPYRKLDVISETASEVFGGEVIVASDGLPLSV